MSDGVDASSDVRQIIVRRRLPPQQEVDAFLAKACAAWDLRIGVCDAGRCGYRDQNGSCVSIAG